MHGKSLAAAAFTFCLASTGMAEASLLTNGSLSGAIANSGVPAGWTILNGSPDTIDEANNVGGGTPFVTPPSGPSPDGGTWVGFARDGGFFESFGQSVGGLLVGESYSLSWYEGNFGAATGAGYGGDNVIQALIDGTPVGTGNTLAGGADWHSAALSFVAPASSVMLSFRLRDTTRSYLSIDGIALEAQNAAATPEPVSAALLGAGLLGLAGLRRRP
jgi:hypothetical protein